MIKNIDTVKTVIHMKINFSNTPLFLNTLMLIRVKNMEDIA